MLFALWFRKLDLKWETEASGYVLFTEWGAWPRDRAGVPVFLSWGRRHAQKRQTGKMQGQGCPSARLSQCTLKAGLRAPKMIKQEFGS